MSAVCRIAEWQDIHAPQNILPLYTRLKYWYFHLIASVRMNQAADRTEWFYYESQRPARKICISSSFCSKRLFFRRDAHLWRPCGCWARPAPRPRASCRRCSRTRCRTPRPSLVTASGSVKLSVDKPDMRLSRRVTSLFSLTRPLRMLINTNKLKISHSSVTLKLTKLIWINH